MDPGVWAAIGTAIAGAIATAVVRWVNNKETKDLSNRVMKVELAEEECQERARIGEGKLLASMERERVLREVVPKRLVEGIETLIGETQQQTAHLAEQTKSLKKIDAWDSDPVKGMKADLEKLKDFMLTQGHKLEHIEMVLAARGRDDTPSVRLEIEQVDPHRPLTVEDRGRSEGS